MTKLKSESVLDIYERLAISIDDYVTKQSIRGIDFTRKLINETYLAYSFYLFYFHIIFMYHIFYLQCYYIQ